MPGQIVKACFLDEKDPLKKWDTAHAEATRIKKWLTGLKVRYLRVRLEEHRPRPHPGGEPEMGRHFGAQHPSFEVFLSRLTGAARRAPTTRICHPSGAGIT
jgi:aminopeptidase